MCEVATYLLLLQDVSVPRVFRKAISAKKVIQEGSEADGKGRMQRFILRT